jgi:hypothetical protein
LTNGGDKDFNDIIVSVKFNWFLALNTMTLSNREAFNYCAEICEISAS